MDSRQRIFLLAIRQALFIILGAIEDLLEMPRSVIPKHAR